MPRKKNLDLAAEMGEEVDVTEEQAQDANVIVPPAPVVAPVSPAPTMSFTMADIQALVASAVEAGGKGNQNLAEIVTQGIAQARKPIPEGTDESNPRISVFNPLGDRDHARPALKCEFFLGTREGRNGHVQRTYPYLADDLTVMEVIALNTLEPVSAKVALLDGSVVPVDVLPTYDPISDGLMRMVIVVPQTVIGRGSQTKNMMPGPLNLVEQITGRNFAKLSTDDLAWFMAEHRAKRFVSSREAIAA